jgi:zinc protease
MKRQFSTLVLISFAFVFVTITVLAGETQIIPPFERFALPNGLDVILVERHAQPTISYAMLIKSGSASDPAGMSGMHIVISRLLRAGTKSYPADRLAGIIDSIGGIIETKNFYKDEILLKGEFLSRDLSLVLKTLSEMMIYPTFTDEGVERLKARVASAVIRAQTIGEFIVREALYNRFYGDKGYGRSMVGEVEQIKNITRADVIKFHNDYFRPENAALILVGDYKPDKARQLITDLFSSWEQGRKIPPVSSAYSIPDSFRIAIMDNPQMSATNFIIGCPAVPPGSDDFAGLILLNYILGQGGGISRLDKDIINESGLATYIRSAIDWSKGNGMFYLSGNCPNYNTSEVIRRSLDILGELRDIRVSQKELDEAKIFLRGQYLSLFETSSGISEEMAFLLSSGVPVDYPTKLLATFEQIDPARLKSIAEKYLNPDHLTAVVYGPASLLKPLLSEIAPTEVVPGKQ